MKWDYYLFPIKKQLLKEKKGDWLIYSMKDSILWHIIRQYFDSNEFFMYYFECTFSSDIFLKTWNPHILFTYSSRTCLHVRHPNKINVPFNSSLHSFQPKYSWSLILSTNQIDAPPKSSLWNQFQSKRPYHLDAMTPLRKTISFLQAPTVKSLFRMARPPR